MQLMSNKADDEYFKPSSAPKEKLTWKSIFAYALGNSGNSLLSGIVYTSISFYYNIKLQADGKLIGLAWLIFLIWNALNDPIFGWITDNTRTRWGRRIPYIRFGSFLYGVLFIFSWFPIAQKGDDWGLFWNFFIVLFLFDTLYSIVGTCYYCLPNEMTTDAEERAKLGFVNSMFWIVVLVVQMIIPLVLLTGQDLNINPLFFPAMFYIAIIAVLLMFFSSFFLKENEFALDQEKEGFIQGIKEVFGNKPFLIFELGNFSLTLMTTIIATGIFYYIDYVLQVNMIDLINGTVVRYDLTFGVVMMLLGLGVGIAIALFKVNSWQPKNIFMLSFTCVSIGFVLFFLTGIGSKVNAIPTGISWFVLILGVAGALIILPAITGDVIDYDELLTGKRREGVYAGFNAIVTKPAISIANWAFLSIIKSFGFNKALSPGLQSQNALVGIMFAIAILPAIFTAITVFVMRWYKLDGDWWRVEKEKIKALHRKKNEIYKQKRLQDSL